MSDKKAVYKLRINKSLTADQKIQNYLKICKLTFECHTVDVINMVDVVKKRTVKNDEEVRPFDANHVEQLFKRLKDNTEMALMEFQQTPYIGYEKDGMIWIIDGKHRLAALSRYAKDTSETIKLQYIIKGTLELAKKLTLISLAGEKLRDSYKPLTKVEIMRHAQVLLTKCPEVLGLPPLPENCRTSYKEGKECQAAIIDFFHVYPSSLVLRNIWKVGRISDEDSKKIFILFEKLPSGFTVDDYDLLFNKYPLAPEGILFLLQENSVQPYELEDLRTKLKNVPKELIPLLKEYEAYDYISGKEEIIKFFVGNNEKLIKYDKVDEILVKYISEKVRNLSRYETTEEKMNFWKKYFESWFEEHIKSDSNNKSESNGKRKRRHHDSQWFKKLIEPQMENPQEAFAALHAHVEALADAFKDDLPDGLKLLKDHLKEDGSLSQQIFQRESSSSSQNNSDASPDTILSSSDKCPIRTKIKRSENHDYYVENPDHSGAEPLHKEP